jgi:glycosyltransferase involved in cell wall biosynthesis
MKKILHIVNELNIGGSETALYRQLLTLSKQSYDFSVIVLTKPGYYSEPIKNLGIPIYYLSINKSNLLKTVYQLIVLIKKIKPTIVQTWLYHSDFLGGICAKLCGVKKIIWGVRCEGIQLKPTTRYVKRVCALLSWLVPDAIITNSQAALRQHVRTGYQAKKMHIIYNGFDTELFSPAHARHPKCSEGSPKPGTVPERRRSLAALGMTCAPALPTNALLIGTLARFHQDKDYPSLIQAVDLVCAQYDNVYFLFCGQGCDAQNAQLNAMLEQITYKDRVILMGKTDSAANYLNQLHIFILSSQT